MLSCRESFIKRHHWIHAATCCNAAAVKRNPVASSASHFHTWNSLEFSNSGDSASSSRHHCFSKRKYSGLVVRKQHSHIKFNSPACILLQHSSHSTPGRILRNQLSQDIEQQFNSSLSVSRHTSIIRKYSDKKRLFPGIASKEDKSPSPNSTTNDKSDKQSADSKNAASASEQLDPAVQILGDMKQYALSSMGPASSANNVADEKQTTMRNSMFLLELKDTLKMERQALEKEKDNSTKRTSSEYDFESVQPVHIYYTKEQRTALTRRILDLYHQNFESARNCNQNSLSVYIDKKRTNNAPSRRVVPPNEKSVSILFYSFTNPRFKDLFDFDYFVTHFLYDIFLYQTNLLSVEFIDQVLKEVVRSNQLIDEGIILFMVYSNFLLSQQHTADIKEKKQHLFECFIFLLRESIKLENSFAINTLLNYGEKHYKETMMQGFDEELTAEHRNQLYICLMDMHARLGNMDAAMKLLRDNIIPRDVTRSTTSQVLTTLLIPYTITVTKSYTRKEKKKMIDRVLHHLPGAKIQDIVIADTILGLYIADREWNKARSFIEQFYSMSEEGLGNLSTSSHDTHICRDGRISPVYMSLIKIFLVYSSFGEAELLEKFYSMVLRSAHRQDHTRLANFILLAHLKSGNSTQTLTRFQELFVSKWQSDPSATNDPDVDTWKIVLQACKATGSNLMLEQVQEELNFELMQQNKKKEKKHMMAAREKNISEPNV